MYKCDFCNRLLKTRGSFIIHKRYCKYNPECNKLYLLTCKKCGKLYELMLNPSQYNKDAYSHYCSISCRNSHKLSDDAKLKISTSLKKYHNNFINSAHIISRNTVYQCHFCNKIFYLSAIWKNRTYCCQECKDRYRTEIWKLKIGGYREGSGRGKSGWYKGIHCDSSWELAYVIYHLDHNLYIKRCKEKRTYIFEGTTYTYYPDFITDNGIIEIKGYSTERWKAKITTGILAIFNIV